MNPLTEKLSAARASGDPGALASVVPMARFLGLELARGDEGVVCRMPFHPKLIGNPGVPALHGGALGTLLESAALFAVVWELDPPALPKTITITVDYLRPAFPEVTEAVVRIVRAGRRVATVQADAWQQGRERLVASAKVHVKLPSR